jgi:hypothetical protein
MHPFSSLCKERSGTVTYTTFGFNCIESARCIYDGTTVPFNYNKYTFPITTTTTTTTTNTVIPTDELKISTNGQCGSKDGKCPNGHCCSKYGWCGTSEQHCLVENGCQSEFGQCKNYQSDPISTTTTTTTTITTTTTTTTDSRNNMACTYYNIKPFSTYCQQRTGTVTYTTYGINCIESVRCIYDGTTIPFNPSIHTYTSTINSIPTINLKITVNGQCGSKDGQCPSGQCCSKYGWCGTSEKHCLVENGCQSEFGQCNTIKIKDLPVSTNGKCGSEDGICPSGHCCSKYGWCGKSSSYCDSGCKKEYGICN